MIGTIVNTCTIIAGSIVGAAMNRGIKEKYKETIYTGLGLVLQHFTSQRLEIQGKSCCKIRH